MFMSLGCATGLAFTCTWVVRTLGAGEWVVRPGGLVVRTLGDFENGMLCGGGSLLELIEEFCVSVCVFTRGESTNSSNEPL